MKRGDLVLVQARIQSIAKDGSWVDVALPTPAPPGRDKSYEDTTPWDRGTAAGKRMRPDGWWTKATRVLPESVYAEQEFHP